MTYRRILVLFAFLAQSTAVCADRLGGEPFGAPCSVWQSVHPSWIERPITPASEVKDADLVITLDQQLYPFLTPAIQTYANTHGLTIAVSNGTCGISAGLLLKKAVDIGGFCCAPGPRDRLPGLSFHTLAIAAIALLVHPDNPVEDVTLSQALGLSRGEITGLSSVIEPSDLGATAFPDALLLSPHFGRLAVGITVRFSSELVTAKDTRSETSTVMG